MSKKMIIGIIVVIIIILLGWWWYSSQSSNSAANDMGMTPEQMAQMGSTTSATQPQVQNQAPSESAGAAPVAAGDSDTDLNQDAAQIDTQMSGLNSDNTNADTSLNSQ